MNTQVPRDYRSYKSYKSYKSEKGQYHYFHFSHCTSTAGLLQLQRQCLTVYMNEVLTSCSTAPHTLTPPSGGSQLDSASSMIHSAELRPATEETRQSNACNSCSTAPNLSARWCWRTATITKGGIGWQARIYREFPSER